MLLQARAPLESGAWARLPVGEATATWAPRARAHFFKKGLSQKLQNSLGLGLLKTLERLIPVGSYWSWSAFFVGGEKGAPGGTCNCELRSLYSCEEHIALWNKVF